MQPLHIIATLATPVAVGNPFGFIPLDEIIVEAALRRNVGAMETARALSPMNQFLVTPSLTTDDPHKAESETLAQLSSKMSRFSRARRAVCEAVALTRIPLARAGAESTWYWRASFSACKSQPTLISRGVHALDAPTLEWWCVGDQDKIASLLTSVNTIGAYRRWHGSVRDWRVNRSNRDWAVWRSARLMRSVPHVDVPTDMRERYLPARWGIRPPYTHPLNQVEVALPPMTDVDSETREPQSDALQWQDLALNRQTRVLVCRGRELHLTPTEADLLGLLICAHGQPVWRETIIRRIWLSDSVHPSTTSWLHRSAERKLDVYIHRLRSYIEHNPHYPTRLITLRGWGFVLR